MTDISPLVTIVAISYNQEEYVIDALNSVKNQTYKNIQLIIADDGSKDKTKELIIKWVAENWPEAIFLNHLQNQGITKNLNSAISYINGEYYQFLGCEDILLPNKIDLQVKLLTNNPAYSIVYSDMYRMDKAGIMEEKTQYQSKAYNIPRSGHIYEYLLERCFISTPTALMRTNVLLALGGDNEKLQINDYDFWLRAAKKYQFLYHDDVTVNYRVLMSSTSNKKGIFRARNLYLLYYLNYDNTYRGVFLTRLLFNVKQLYYAKYKLSSWYAFKAFFKTGSLQFAKFIFLGLPLLLTGQKG